MADFQIFVNDTDGKMLEEEAFRVGVSADALFKVWVYQMLESKKFALRTRNKKEPKRQPGRPRTRKFDQDVLYIRERYERLKEICTPEEYQATHAALEANFEKAVKSFDEATIAEFLRQQPWKRK